MKDGRGFADLVVGLVAGTGYSGLFPRHPSGIGVFASLRAWTAVHLLAAASDTPLFRAWCANHLALVRFLRVLGKRIDFDNVWRFRLSYEIPYRER